MIMELFIGILDQSVKYEDLEKYLARKVHPPRHNRSIFNLKSEDSVGKSVSGPKEEGHT